MAMSLGDIWEILLSWSEFREDKSHKLYFFVPLNTS